MNLLPFASLGGYKRETLWIHLVLLHGMYSMWPSQRSLTSSNVGARFRHPETPVRVQFTEGLQMWVKSFTLKHTHRGITERGLPGTESRGHSPIWPQTDVKRRQRETKRRQWDTLIAKIQQITTKRHCYDNQMQHDQTSDGNRLHRDTTWRKRDNKRPQRDINRNSWLLTDAKWLQKEM